ncbi:hypothetical protein L6164_016786 [Bauhinia variegata]|uniref:Uncharacterized protein n=1 Tax=Bauhinia variegata TaxID=167791 RepID=A0ACB9N9G8_BAUVA|nr:hypothetical protein L6164_016786 [Bauhinia variegata]
MRCGGDFNSILQPHEKKGGVDSDERDMEDFRDFLTLNQLEDFGFIREKFTWCNKQKREECIWERLDRWVANVNWQVRHPKATMWNLEGQGSDHKAILLNSDPYNVKIKRNMCLTLDGQRIDK